MSKHAAPEPPEDDDDFPAWQVGFAICFIVFFAVLGIWRIVLEFIVR